MHKQAKLCSQGWPAASAIGRFHNNPTMPACNKSGFWDKQHTKPAWSLLGYYVGSTASLKYALLPTKYGHLQLNSQLNRALPKVWKQSMPGWGQALCHAHITPCCMFTAAVASHPGLRGSSIYLGVWGELAACRDWLVPLRWAQPCLGQQVREAAMPRRKRETETMEGAAAWGWLVAFLLNVLWNIKEPGGWECPCFYKQGPCQCFVQKDFLWSNPLCHPLAQPWQCVCFVLPAQPWSVYKPPSPFQAVVQLHWHWRQQTPLSACDESITSSDTLLL